MYTVDFPFAMYTFSQNSFSCKVVIQFLEKGESTSVPLFEELWAF